MEHAPRFRITMAASFRSIARVDNAHSSSISPTMSLEQVGALHDEMAALVRAGVPLERGLAELGRDLPRQLRQATTTMSERLQRGESLAQIMADPQLGLPEAHRVVIAAGVRAGRLSAALEDVARAARRSAETRRAIGFALVYPILVMSLAYSLLIGSLLFFVPQVVAAFGDFSDGESRLVKFLDFARSELMLWAPWPPIVVGAALWIYWRRAASPLRSERMFTLVPSMSPARVMQMSGLATLADLLGLLLAHDVPLGEALPLAAAATGHHAWQRSAEQIAERLQQGQSFAQALHEIPQFPARVGWLVAGDFTAKQRAANLRDAAESYRVEASRTVERLSTYLPIILGAVIGGATTFAFVLVVLSPYIDLMYRMGRQL